MNVVAIDGPELWPEVGKLSHEIQARFSNRRIVKGDPVETRDKRRSWLSTSDDKVPGGNGYEGRPSFFVARRPEFDVVSMASRR